MADPRSEDERRSRRAKGRHGWPVRVLPLGHEPSDDLSGSTTASQRLEMMWPLARSAWLLAHGEIPSYRRSELPCTAVRLGNDP